MTNPGAVPLTIDTSFLAALKLHVYETIDDTLLSALRSGRAITVTDALRLEIGRFTARRLSHLFLGENGARGHYSAEFFGFTSHKVREKLFSLQKSGYIELVGRGLRDAFTYRWKLPIKHWDICAYMRFSQSTREDLTANLELVRIHEGMGRGPFTVSSFLDLYRQAHAEEFGHTRWGKRRFQEITGSYAYASFLRGRLERLHSLGLLEKRGDETYELSSAGADAATYFGFFLHDIGFRPSREMCRACPNEALCKAGKTQLLVLTLNKNQDSLPSPPILEIC